VISWHSIRFRLSVQYSAVVFGLGGAVLGLVYLGVQRGLREDTMNHYLVGGRPVLLQSGEVVTLLTIERSQVQAIQSIYNEVILDRVARFTFIGLAFVFLVSLVVGWVMSGRVLKPVEAITTVAKQIQASDLSRRIALEGPDDELTRLADTFDGMLDRLDNAFSSQRRFLADTSHDLRTPLAVIQANVELVADDPEASIAEWEEAGGIVRRNTEKMSKMIDGLLAAARLQTGKSQAVSLDLAELVEAKATEFTPVAADRGITVHAEVAPTVVEGVEVPLDRALSNLLENAQRVAPEGSTIKLGSGVVEGWAWMAVEDHGPGLPTELEDRIGLGLSIVTQIAEAHGGALDSYAGSDELGTTMVVWLPTKDAAESHPKVNPFTND
jgi:signal transduction histidine kinase